MTDSLLICTDLDRTLIPNGPQAESSGARRHFAALTAHEHVTLAYVTGRHRTLVEEAMNTFRLPVPDFVIADVGTNIYRVGPKHEWSLQHDWADEIGQDWAGCSYLDLASLLSDLRALRMQERMKQNRHKLSYYLPLYQDIDQLAAAIRERLEPAGFKVRLVWSVDDATDVGLLDILPERASKRHAIEALMRRLDFVLEDTIFCGDSGNDMEVLISPIPSVLVANSRPEVKRLARELSAESGTLDALYAACGEFQGMNGNYSAGMLEGIAHYHPDTIGWMGFQSPASEAPQDRETA